MTEPPRSPAPAAPPPDPMRGFRGICAATLTLEAIVVALALPVVAKLGAGLDTGQGALVGGLAVAMLAAVGLLRFRWGLVVVLALQVVMIACVFVVVTLGVLGVVFGLVWGYLLWLRREVARRMAEGSLPSQRH